MSRISVEEMIAFEARVADAFNRGEIRAPIHLSGGNELELREIFLEVRDEDYVVTTWRSHYHCLLKGVPAERLYRDILQGKSITLCYPEYRVLSSAIVGGHVPLALGLALSVARQGGSEKVHCFMGDMAARSGIVWECRRYAVGHKLPIAFYEENNGISVCTPTKDVWGHEPINHQVWDGRLKKYQYHLNWPHSGAGKRVEF